MRPGGGIAHPVIGVRLLFQSLKNENKASDLVRCARNSLSHRLTTTIIHCTVCTSI